MRNREADSIGVAIVLIVLGVLIIALTGHHTPGPGGDVGLGIAIGAMILALGAGVVIGARGSRREG